MAIVLLSSELSRLMQFFSIDNEQLAQVLGTDRRTVNRWLADQTIPQRESRYRLAALEALETRLRETFVSESGAQQWLYGRSGYFGGLTPADALIRGRIDAVNAALESLDSGAYV